MNVAVSGSGKHDNRVVPYGCGDNHMDHSIAKVKKKLVAANHDCRSEQQLGQGDDDG